MASIKEIRADYEQKIRALNDESFSWRLLFKASEKNEIHWHRTGAFRAACIEPLRASGPTFVYYEVIKGEAFPCYALLTEQSIQSLINQSHRSDQEWYDLRQALTNAQNDYRAALRDAKIGV